MAAALFSAPDVLRDYVSPAMTNRLLGASPTLDHTFIDHSPLCALVHAFRTRHSIIRMHAKKKKSQNAKKIGMIGNRVSYENMRRVSLLKKNPD